MMQRPAVVAATMLLVAVLIVGCAGPASDSGESSGRPVWRRAFPTDDVGWVLSAAGRRGDAIFAVGGVPGDGAGRRYDGDEWREMELPEDAPLLTWVHCFEDGTPVVAGFQGRLLRRTERGWKMRELPTDKNLWGVWGTGPDNLWVVGGETSAGAPVVLHRNAGGWRQMALPPLREDDVHTLFKVWGRGPDEVYFVGQNGTILRWTGEEIVDESPETGKDFVSVWGAEGTTAAIGGRGNGVLAVRQGEQKWRVHSMAPLFGLNGIWLEDGETAWIAGAGGTVAEVDLAADPLEWNVHDVDSEVDFHAIYGLRGVGLYAVGGNLQSRGGPYRGGAYHRPAAD